MIRPWCPPHQNRSKWGQVRLAHSPISSPQKRGRWIQAEERGPGPPALGEVHRERRLDHPGHDRVQPHPRRREHRRRRTGQGDDRDDPPPSDPRRGPRSQHRPAPAPAPTGDLALGRGVHDPVRGNLRATTSSYDLTDPPATATGTTPQWKRRAHRRIPRAPTPEPTRRPEQSPSRTHPGGSGLSPTPPSTATRTTPGPGTGAHPGRHRGPCHTQTEESHPAGSRTARPRQPPLTVKDRG
jgi:hypothetical protein